MPFCSILTKLRAVKNLKTGTSHLKSGFEQPGPGASVLGLAKSIYYAFFRDCLVLVLAECVFIIGKQHIIYMDGSIFSQCNSLFSIAAGLQAQVFMDSLGRQKRWEKKSQKNHGVWFTFSVAL